MLIINSKIDTSYFKEKGKTLYNFFSWYLGMQGWDNEDNLMNLADVWESENFLNYLIENEFETYYDLANFINCNKEEIIDVKQEIVPNTFAYKLTFTVKNVPFVLITLNEFSWDKII